MTHPVIARLASRDPEIRREACRDAAEDPSGVVLVDALTSALGDPVRAVSLAASDSLVALARNSGDVETSLRDALRGDTPALRWSAAFTLARLAPPGVRLLPALVEALGADDGKVRWSAARLLVETGHLTGEVLPLLLGLVRDDAQPVVRRMATHCLRQLAPDRLETARALVEATRDDDVLVRRAALAALSALIDPPPEVATRLAEALESDSDGASRRIATVGLGEIGSAAGLPEAALAALRRARENPADADLRQGADRALRKAGVA